MTIQQSSILISLNKRQIFALMLLWVIIVMLETNLTMLDDTEENLVSQSRKEKTILILGFRMASKGREALKSKLFYE